MKYVIAFVLCIASINAYAAKRYHTNKEIACLVKNAYNEARGEGEKGVQLVTQVVLNRARIDGKGICEVIYEPGQFSWVSAPLAVSDEFNKESKPLIVAMYTGKKRLSKKYRNIYYFHKKGLRRVWTKGLRLTIAHKSHVFYNKEGT